MENYEKVLFINACTRKESRTRRLAQALLDKLGNSANIEEVDLYSADLPMLNEAALAFRDKAYADEDFSDPYFDLAKQFAAADLIIIAAPYWNLSFPAVLKQYLDLVTVSGIAFYYTNDGEPHGLCAAKRLYYVTTSGGEIGQYNMGYDYVKALTTVLCGVKRTFCLRAVGLDLEWVDGETVLENAIRAIAEADPDSEE